MAIDIKVDTNGDFGREFRKAMGAVSDLTVPLRLITKSWFKSNKAIFKLKGPGKYKDLSTKPFFAWWEPKGSSLRTKYLNGYRSYKTAKYGFAYPILKATGTLEDSLTSAGALGSIANIINKNSLVLGTSIPWAVFHQSDEPRTKMPFRPMVLIGSEQVAQGIPGFTNRHLAWIETIKSYVEQSLDGVAEQR